MSTLNTFILVTLSSLGPIFEVKTRLYELPSSEGTGFWLRSAHTWIGPWPKLFLHCNLDVDICILYLHLHCPPSHIWRSFWGFCNGSGSPNLGLVGHRSSRRSYAKRPWPRPLCFFHNVIFKVLFCILCQSSTAWRREMWSCIFGLFIKTTTLTSLWKARRERKRWRNLFGQ